jgi:hypothetical protein
MRTALPALLVAACTDTGDVTGTDGTTGFQAPDIAGSYDSAVVSGDAAALPWLDGPLEVTGDAAALTWAFGAESFTGRVDDAFAFDFSGATSVGEVVGAGTVYLDDDVWNLDGDVTLTPDDTAVSSSAATFTAIQVLP